jgi:xanthine dehydrogenase accessory factor
MIAKLLQDWSTSASDVQAVLCSVIQWKGSIPRKDYPLMLVLEDGSLIGTIGGGSMELKIIQSAMKMMGDPESRIFDFDMTGSDVNADLGLCGGTLQVLVEPFTPDLQNFYTQLLSSLHSHPKTMVQMDILRTPSVHISRKLISRRHDLIASQTDLADHLQKAFESQRTTLTQGAGKMVLLWQPFAPPAVHIFGAGHVGQAVAHLADYNDIQVHVYDDRRNLLTSARFPHARLVEINFPVEWSTLPDISPLDLVLVASREHHHDRELLAGLLQCDRRYVGLVSSSRKWSLLLRALEEDGITSERLQQVKAPVGLNINAQTVPEIAVSILAEMIASYRNPE